MSSQDSRKPDPVDKHVGAKMKQRRKELKMSQEALAAEMDVTFQMIGKREDGIARVSAGVLWKTSRALDVPLMYFFEGL